MVPSSRPGLVLYAVQLTADWLAVRPARHASAIQMAQALAPVEVPETKSIATIDSTFVIMAECNCSHRRELHTLFLRRQLGAGVTIGQVRRKLRCHVCQARMPVIRIYPQSV